MYSLWSPSLISEGHSLRIQKHVATLVRILAKHLESLQHDDDFSPFHLETASSLTAGLTSWVPSLGGKAVQKEGVAVRIER